MAFQIFGFEIRKQQELPSIASPNINDGAIEQVVGSGAAYYGYAFDINKRLSNEYDLINKYRSMAQIAEIDSAIEEIVTEAIVVEEEKLPVSINIVAEDSELPPQIREAIVAEFENIIALMKFNTDGHDIFRQWYVDGRLYGQLVVDETNLAAGIIDIKFIDPRKIKKVREVQKEKSLSGVDIVTDVREYFIFNDAGISNSNNGIQISPDVIIYASSGMTDEYGNTTSHLTKTIKPANMLRYIEDAVLIYTLARAPERRVFYIDVADMPKQKAEQYVRDVMTRYKNKVIYNSSTGEISDDRVHMSMLEDFWMPRRSNGRTTEITTLPGSSIMSQMDNVNYFLNKLYASLNLPLSRVRPDANFSLGRTTEISRDEVKFSKFIARLRRKFSDIFYQALRAQLILKGIIAPEDWTYVKSKINFDFLRDNYFSELKENEILAGRIQMAEQMQPYVGMYYSMEYVRKNVLKQTTEEIERIDMQIAEERAANPEMFGGGDNSDDGKEKGEK
jgi:hypothetical protein